MQTSDDNRAAATVRLEAHRAKVAGATALASRVKTLRRAGRLQVLLLDARMPLVRAGGTGLADLREEVFDAVNNTNGRAGLSHDSAATYAFALMGGEPYAIWN